MFQDSFFKAKFLLGWIPSAYLLGTMLAAMGAGEDALTITFVLCLLGLVSLGIMTVVYRFKGQAPVNWEIVWWIYPTAWFLNFFWQLIKRALR